MQTTIALQTEAISIMFHFMEPLRAVRAVFDPVGWQNSNMRYPWRITQKECFLVVFWLFRVRSAFVPNRFW